jgi:GNAT superfamily N-acetyltransferase
MPDWLIAPYEAADLPAVVALVNAAYRGEGAAAGWTTEAGYIDGQRTSIEDLAADLAAGTKPTLLVLRAAGGEQILACAMIERLTASDGAIKAYIGMITVDPAQQAAGLGRVILAAAEDHARALGARRAEMTVVSIRDTLIAWYERRGWRLTGEVRPFPYDDARFGIPLRPDLAFVVLERPLG